MVPEWYLILQSILLIVYVLLFSTFKTRFNGIYILITHFKIIRVNTTVVFSISRAYWISIIR